MGLFDNVVPGGKLGKPLGIALLALLAYRAFKGGGGAHQNRGGGLLDNLFGGSDQARELPPPGPQREQMQASIPDGLQELLGRFQQGGLGELISSWIGTGSNKPIAPQQVSQALEPNEIDELARRTGLSRQQVLDELARALPTVIDRLTPEGRIPEQGEVSQGYHRPG